MDIFEEGDVIKVFKYVLAHHFFKRPIFERKGK
jgi:hypothetical protein